VGDRSVQCGFTFERVEVTALTGRAQQLFHYQVRRWLDADLRARQEYLRASADGDAPFQYEWPEWLLGPGPFAVGCHSPPLERLSGKRDSEKASRHSLGQSGGRRNLRTKLTRVRHGGRDTPGFPLVLAARWQGCV